MIDEYIRQYGRRLYGLCMTLCKNTFDADDLYQDTWLKVVKSIDHYDCSREFEPWLIRICVNTYRNRLRRIARSPLLSFSDTEEKDRVLASVAAPEKRDYLPLYEAVDALPDKLRVTVILFYFRDMDLASVANILQIPAGTVKSRLHKAREMLRKKLGEELIHETGL